MLPNLELGPSIEALYVTYGKRCLHHCRVATSQRGERKRRGRPSVRFNPPQTNQEPGSPRGDEMHGHVAGGEGLPHAVRQPLLGTRQLRQVEEGRDLSPAFKTSWLRPRPVGSGSPEGSLSARSRPEPQPAPAN